MSLLKLMELLLCEELGRVVFVSHLLVLSFLPSVLVCLLSSQFLLDPAIYAGFELCLGD